MKVYRPKNGGVPNPPFFFFVSGDRKTASPFPLHYTSKAGFPLQISTGGTMPICFPMWHKKYRQRIVCGYQPPLRCVMRRKITTNPQTVQVFRQKKCKFFEVYPDFDVMQ